MKKLLLLAASALIAVGAFAQGNVNFANIGVGVNAPVRDATAGNALAAGAAYAAMLYIGPSGAGEGTLSTNGVSGSPATFNTGAQAGYFTGSSRILTGYPGGSPIALQVRVWSTASGNSWETATVKGQSTVVTFTPGTPPATAPNITALNGQTITLVPEPSSIALGLLGLGALALIRRRK
jgi:MYXO-CTERM domain-containing protein